MSLVHRYKQNKYDKENFVLLVHWYKQNKYDRNSLKKQDNVLLSQVSFHLGVGENPTSRSAAWYGDHHPG
jgi:hypothetical protein